MILAALPRCIQSRPSSHCLPLKLLPFLRFSSEISPLRSLISPLLVSGPPTGTVLSSGLHVRSQQTQHYSRLPSTDPLPKVNLSLRLWHVNVPPRTPRVPLLGILQEPPAGSEGCELEQASVGRTW